MIRAAALSLWAMAASAVWGQAVVPAAPASAPAPAVTSAPPTVTPLAPASPAPNPSAPPQVVTPTPRMTIPPQNAMPPPSGAVPRAPAPPAPPTPPVKGLPPDAPKLVINGGTYSERRELRMAIVNGNVVREGQEVEGVRIERIDRDGVVLVYRGSRFHVLY